MLVTVPRVSRSCELFPDGFDLHPLKSCAHTSHVIADFGFHSNMQDCSSQTPDFNPQPRNLKGGPRGVGVFLWARYPCTAKTLFCRAQAKPQTLTPNPETLNQKPSPPKPETNLTDNLDPLAVRDPTPYTLSQTPSPLTSNFSFFFFTQPLTPNP